MKESSHDHYIRTLAAPAPDARLYTDRPCPNYGCDPPGSLRMGARQMPRDPPPDPACPILSGVDRLSVGADGVRCSPPPEALPETFCLRQRDLFKSTLISPSYRTHRLVDFRYNKSKHTSKYRRKLLWQALFRYF